VVTKFRPIKAKPFKADAFKRVMRPKAQKIKNGIKADFNRGTSSWEHKVKWRATVSFAANGGFTIIVDTDDEIYGYVHDGTPPHEIAPVNSPYLIYLEGYNTKTEPGIIDSRSGGAYGDEIRNPYPVQHPGTEGRFFNILVKELWELPFYDELRQAMDEAIRQSGHEF